MTASLRAFLDGLIDYAGLFPPASLDMPEAVATYARHLDSNHAWMVSRFVCPLSRLDAFAAEGDRLLRKFSPVRVAGLSSRIGYAESMVQVAVGDAARARNFEQKGWGLVDVLEVHLPDDLIDGEPSEISLSLDRYEETLRSGGMKLERLFYEISRDRAWSDRVERLAVACSGAKHRGFKIRCGGMTPDAYPTVKEVTDAIAICARRGVPYKATAGLHHPVRQKRPESGITQHGFVNVFAAGLLASKTDADLLARLVDDQDLGHFDFSEDYLAWGGLEIPADSVAAMRRSFAITYGSCDIDEPVEDLETAGLL